MCSGTRPSILLSSHLPQSQSLPASVPLWNAVRHASSAIGYEELPAEEADEISHCRDPAAETTCSPGPSRGQSVHRLAPWRSLSQPGKGGTALAVQKSRINISPKNQTAWVNILQRAVRIRGHEGAWAFFQQLKDQMLHLPTAGDDAKHLWEPITAAASDLDRTEELWTYVMNLYKRTGKVYDNLYASMISRSLRRSREDAQRMHDSFVEAGLPTLNGLERLFGSFPLTQETSPTLRRFYQYAAPTTQSDIKSKLYDTIMGRLYHQRMFHQAVLWNEALLHNQDIPGNADAIRPLFRHLEVTGRYETVSEILLVLRTKYNYVGYVDSLDSEFSRRYPTPWGITNGSQKPKSDWVNDSLRVVRPCREVVGSQYEPNRSNGPSTLLETLSGRSYFPRRRDYFNDDFCARAFATKAFTPSFVIRSMSTFGVESIGPLSVRELAVRVSDLLQAFKPDEHDFHGSLVREVVAHLQQLEEADIRLRPCKFNTVISRLASENQGQLLEATLKSDLHPDVYEDEALLQRLLHGASRKVQYLELHRLLTVLSIAHAQTHTWAWNELLKYSIEEESSGRVGKMDFVLTSMRKLQVPITTDTVSHSYFRLLRPFKPGKRPLKTYDERTRKLDTLVRMWMDALNTGCHVPAAGWNYIIRRYGMTMQFDRLERLCLWLAHFYRSKPEGRIETARRSSKTQLDHVFPPEQQRSIVEWYFKTMPLYYEFRVRHPGPVKRPAPLSPEFSGANPPLSMQHVDHFARGLAILRMLARNGLHVKQASVRSAVVHRLRILYGAGRSKLKANNDAADGNPFTLHHMVRCVQEIWAPVGKLLNAPRALLKALDYSDDAQRLSLELELTRKILGDVVLPSPPAVGVDRSRPGLGYRYRMSNSLARKVQMVNKNGAHTGHRSRITYAGMPIQAHPPRELEDQQQRSQRLVDGADCE